MFTLNWEIYSLFVLPFLFLFFFSPPFISFRHVELCFFYTFGMILKLNNIRKIAQLRRKNFTIGVQLAEYQVNGKVLPFSFFPNGGRLSGRSGGGGGGVEFIITWFEFMWKLCSDHLESKSILKSARHSPLSNQRMAFSPIIAIRCGLPELVQIVNYRENSERVVCDFHL